MLSRILLAAILVVTPIQASMEIPWCDLQLVSGRSTPVSQQANATQSREDEAPEWARREYDHPANQVYAAALKSIQQQKHEVQSRNEDILTVDFHVGITAWSWGYNMRLVVTPVAEHRAKVVIGVLRSGGKVFSWGSGRKEVRKVFAGIDAELTASKANSPKPTTEASNAENSSVCVVQIQSDPTGADVELDGKFVGNTPATLRLKAGEYTVTVRKAGFAPWSRKLTTIADSELRVMAELKKED